jgi:hypothetical protein
VLGTTIETETWTGDDHSTFDDYGWNQSPLVAPRITGDDYYGIQKETVYTVET